MHIQVHAFINSLVLLWCFVYRIYDSDSSQDPDNHRELKG